MSNDAEQIMKDQMRMLALETIVCQHFATVYHTMLPPGFFDTIHKRAIEGARRQTFAGADAVHSDLLSAELEASLDRLYNMIKSHLDSFQRQH